MASYVPKDCTELFGVDPASGMRVLQLTDDSIWHGNVYPETPVFLSDRRHFLIGSAEGFQIACLDGGDPKTVLSVYPDGSGRHRAAILTAPDGSCIYYIDVDGDNAALMRVCPPDFVPETVCPIPYTIPGTDFHPSRYYSIGTVSSDGKRFATSCFLGDGKTEDPPFGLLVIDMEHKTVHLAAWDAEFGNAHLQYCRSADPGASHDLMIQMNHGMQHKPDGSGIRGLEPPPSGLGVDVHIIRDDGTNWRDMPWGRDGKESCIGHQIWRGTGTSAVTITLEAMDETYGFADDTSEHIIEGWAHPSDRLSPHIGCLNPASKRNVLTAKFEHPRFCHFAMDDTGLKFALDTFPVAEDDHHGQRVYTGITAPDGTLRFRFILNNGGEFGQPGAGGGSATHAHPVLTPDGTGLLFNSTITGKGQVYLVENVQFASVTED